MARTGTYELTLQGQPLLGLGASGHPVDGTRDIGLGASRGLGTAELGDPVLRW